MIPDFGYIKVYHSFSTYRNGLRDLKIYRLTWISANPTKGGVRRTPHRCSSRHTTIVRSLYAIVIASNRKCVRRSRDSLDLTFNSSTSPQGTLNRRFEIVNARCNFARISYIVPAKQCAISYRSIIPYRDMYANVRPVQRDLVIPSQSQLAL